MSNYKGRAEDCTTPSRKPSASLVAHAKENGLETALVGVLFKGTPDKIYSYWGDTSMTRGNYVYVNVSGTIKRVRVVANIATTAFKADNTRTAKHAQQLSTKPASYDAIKLPGLLSGVVQNWYNQALLETERVVPSEHAKQCVSDIDGMLASGEAVELKVTTGLTQEKLDYYRRAYTPDPQTEYYAKSLVEGDYPKIESRVAAFLDRDAWRAGKGRALHTQWEEWARQAGFPPYAGTVTGRISGASISDNLSKGDRVDQILGKRIDQIVVDESLWAHDDKLDPLRFGPALFRPSQLQTWDCPNTIKENAMTTKIETVTYVTLPNNSRRDAKSLSADEFFEAISALEKQVSKYEAITNKPRALQERIDETKTQIADLSALCDSLHATKVEATTAPPALPGSTEA